MGNTIPQKLCCSHFFDVVEIVLWTVYVVCVERCIDVIVVYGNKGLCAILTQDGCCTHDWEVVPRKFFFVPVCVFVEFVTVGSVILTSR